MCDVCILYMSGVEPYLCGRCVCLCVCVFVCVYVYVCSRLFVYCVSV